MDKFNNLKIYKIVYMENFHLVLNTGIFILILAFLINYQSKMCKKKFIDSIKYGSVFRDIKKDYSEYEYKIIDLDIHEIKKLCPEPPKNSSKKTYQELKFLEKKIKNMGEKDIEIFDDLDTSANLKFNEFIYDNNLDVDYNDYYQFLNELEYMTYHLKYLYNRPRAYQLGIYLNVPIKSQYAISGNTPAYPSGHAMLGHGSYLYLKELYPEHEKELYKLAKQVENSRVDVGVHYVSDGNASEILLNKLFKKIKKNLYKKNINQEMNINQETSNNNQEMNNIVQELNYINQEINIPKSRININNEETNDSTINLNYPEINLYNEEEPKYLKLN